MRIPKTIDGAVKALEGVGALLTAKEWERAAIVYAFTTEQQGKRTDLTSGSSTGSLSITEFAELGISGLASDRTVRTYRNAWKLAVAAHDAADRRRPSWEREHSDEADALVRSLADDVAHRHGIRWWELRAALWVQLNLGLSRGSDFVPDFDRTFEEQLAEASPWWAEQIEAGWRLDVAASVRPRLLKLPAVPS